jgi:hypothetical protein
MQNARSLEQIKDARRSLEAAEALIRADEGDVLRHISKARHDLMMAMYCYHNPKTGKLTD